MGLVVGLLFALAGTAQAQSANYYSSATLATGDAPESIAVGDLNGDGRPDIATANEAAATVTVLTKDATGPGYTAATAGTTGSSPRAIAIGDLNADGRPDIAVANAFSNSITVFTKDPLGVGYIASTVGPTGSVPFSVAIADFNADGRPDLAAANSQSNSVSVFFKDAIGTGYTAQPQVPASAGTRSLAVADLNADGRLDIVTASFTGSSVSVLLRDAAGSGYTASSHATGANPTSVRIGDLNADALPDIAVVNAGANSVSYLLANAGGGFGAATTMAAGFLLKGLGMADLNGDGRVDLATATGGSNIVERLLKDATGSGYTRSTVGATGAEPNAIAIADVNADSRLDIASADRNSDSVTLFTALFDPDAPTTTDDVGTGFSTGPVTVTLTATDTGGSGLASTKYLIGANPGDPSASGSGASTYNPASKPVLQPGQKIRYSSTDNVGNVEAAKTSATVKTDQAAPTTTADVPTVYRNEPITVTLTAGDGSGSGVASTRYLIGAAPGDPTAAGSGAATYDPANKPVLQDGERIRYSSTDNVGNVEAAKTSAAAKVDTATPTTTDNVPPEARNAPVRVTLSADDTGGSGLASTVYLIGADPGDPTASGSGASTYDPASKPVLQDGEKIRYSSSDNAGNVEPARTSVAAQVDLSPPAPPTFSVTLPASPADDNAPRVRGTADGGATVRLYTDAACTEAAGSSALADSFADPGIEVSVSDDSSTRFYATAADAVGNVSGCSADSIVYVEDSTAPGPPSGLVSTPRSPSSDNTPKLTGGVEAGTTVRAYLSADCSGTPAATGSAADFETSGLTITVPADSTSELRASAVDAAGNVSPCSSAISYLEDSQAPTSSASAPASADTSDSSIAVAYTADGTGADLATVDLYVMGPADTDFAKAASDSTPAGSGARFDYAATQGAGEYAFYTRATDAAGNAEDAPGAADAKTVRGGAPASPDSPTIAITSPVDGARYRRDQRVEAAFSCADPDGPADVSSCEGTVAPGAPVATAAAGVQTFKVTAVDRAGHSVSKTVRYTVDDSAPSITISSPEDVSYRLDEKVVAKFACLDDSGFGDVARCVGPVASGDVIDTATAGRHAFKVTTADEAGNTAARSVVYMVDDSSPAITVDVPSEGASYARGRVVTAHYACRDEDGAADVAKCAGPIASGEQLDTDTEGRKEFTVLARDRAGNAARKVVEYVIGPASTPAPGLAEDDGDATPAPAPSPAAEPFTPAPVAPATPSPSTPRRTSPPAASPTVAPAPPQVAPSPGDDAAAREAPSRKEQLEPYDPRSEPSKTVEIAVAGFVLLELVGSGGLALAGMAGGGGGAVAAKERKERKEGKVKSAKVKHIKDAGLEGTALGDRSRSWRFPGTPTVDAVSLALPVWLAGWTPLLARITADGSYLRAMFGSASLLGLAAGAVLGGLAVSDVGGEALPPVAALTIAIAVLGVIDASAGFMAVLIFVSGVAMLGGIDSAASGRTLLGLCGIWFVVPLLASAARPLRRAPAVDFAERFDRVADFVIASLIGAWAVQQIVRSLPGLAGYELPIADSANQAALAVLIALLVRMAAETLAANLFPERLKAVNPPEIPRPPEGRQVPGALFRAAVFVFVAISVVGSSWQLWVGAVLFLVPQILKIYERRMPVRPSVGRVVPEGLLKVVFMLFLMSACGALVIGALRGSENLIPNAFVLLALPGFALALLGAAAGKLPKQPVTWKGRLGGIVILSLGILQVNGLLA
jgi:hypothetical protein